MPDGEQSSNASITVRAIAVHATAAGGADVANTGASGAVLDEANTLDHTW